MIPRSTQTEKSSQGFKSLLMDVCRYTRIFILAIVIHLVAVDWYLLEFGIKKLLLFFFDILKLIVKIVYVDEFNDLLK